MGPLSADNFTVNPVPLETQGGQVPATINGTFPAKYMKKKAVVTVTPELRYADGKVSRGDAATFQGEKVMGNDQTILQGRWTLQHEDQLHFQTRYGKERYVSHFRC